MNFYLVLEITHSTLQRQNQNTKKLKKNINIQLHNMETLNS